MRIRAWCLVGCAVCLAVPATGAENRGGKAAVTPAGKLVELLCQALEEQPRVVRDMSGVVVKLRDPEQAKTIPARQAGDVAKRVRKYLATTKEVSTLIAEEKPALDRAGIDMSMWARIAMRNRGLEEVVPVLEGIAAGKGTGAGSPMSRALAAAMKRKCFANLMQIGMSLRMFSADNGRRFPDTLQALSPKYMPNSKLLACPCGSDKVGYGYVSGLSGTAEGDWILVFDKKGNHDDGRNVLLVNGRPQWVAEGEFVSRLKATLDAAKKRGVVAKIIE